MATLLLFAAIREAARCSRATVEASSVGEALKVATERYGERFERVLACCTILHDEQTIAPDQWWARAISPDDEIAILPPVSGGTDPKMIDVGDKPETRREATAVCRLVCSDASARDRILTGAGAKGDATGPATVAGMLAAKRVPELLPHCHPVRLTDVEITHAPAGDEAIEVRATVRGLDRTGFEMEALTACAVAALTLYDVGKPEDPRMRIDALRIVAKSGGKSGSVTYD